MSIPGSNSSKKKSMVYKHKCDNCNELCVSTRDLANHYFALHTPNLINPMSQVPAHIDRPQVAQWPTLWRNYNLSQIPQMYLGQIQNRSNASYQQNTTEVPISGLLPFTYLPYYPSIDPYNMHIVNNLMNILDNQIANQIQPNNMFNSSQPHLVNHLSSNINAQTSVEIMKKNCNKSSNNTRTDAAVNNTGQDIKRFGLLDNNQNARTIVKLNQEQVSSSVVNGGPIISSEMNKQHLYKEVAANNINAYHPYQQRKAAHSSSNTLKTCTTTNVNESETHLILNTVFNSIVDAKKKDIIPPTTEQKFK